MSTTVPEREDSLCTDFFLGGGGINSPWAEWEEVVMIPPYLRLVDDVNLHCCAETLLRRACVPPTGYERGTCPPEPRPEMKSLLCHCRSWWSRWGWDGRLYFWTTPPAVFTFGPHWSCSSNHCRLQTWQHGGSGLWLSCSGSPKGTAEGEEASLVGWWEGSVMVQTQETLHHWHYSAESIIRLLFGEILIYDHFWARLTAANALNIKKLRLVRAKIMSSCLSL